MKTIVSLLSAALIALPALAVDAPQGSFGQRVMTGFAPFQPPGEALAYADGTTGSLHDYRGKVVVAPFWATWCGACKNEMPDFEALAETIDHPDFIVLPVSLDDGMNGGQVDIAKAKVSAFYEQRGFDALPVAIDVGRMNGSLLHGGDPVRTPTTFVMNKRGEIVAAIPGAFAGWLTPEARTWIDALLAEES